MIKKFFIKIHFLLVTAICFSAVLFCAAFKAPVKLNSNIVLQDERLTFSPKEFFIQEVTDDRRDTHNIALLVTDAALNKTQAVDLEGGTTSAMRKFISHNMSVNTALRPLAMHINDLKITETALPDGRIEGKINLALSFERKFADDNNVYLFSYKGAAKYIRPEKQQQVIEPTLRKTLQNALVYLNAWMNKEADNNPKLAKQVKLSITDFTENTDPDTIYYTARRPLIWSDFKARPINGSRYAAEVFPSLAFDEEVDVVNSVIQVKLKMKVYLPKSASWVREGYRDDYTLNHEQRHFDIVKLVSEHYKRALLAEQQPVNNYDGAIHTDYLEAFREMNRLQKQYDDETRHGLNQYAQAEWNERIDKELKSLGVK